MTGPRIVKIDAEDIERPIRKHFEKQTGVRPMREGGYIAIKAGRFAGEFHGKRAFLAATRAAGSTTVLR